MRTIKEFDYDLWAIEENGTKRYFARVKETGEESEISIEVMRVLLAQEKKMRRDMQKRMDAGGILSTDQITDDGTSEEWLTDPYDLEDDVTTRIMEDGFIKTLTAHQRKVYGYCIKEGMTPTMCARRIGVSRQAVDKVVGQIQEKAKKNFA